MILVVIVAVVAFAGWMAWNEYRTRPVIPQSEIDTETRRILIEYPGDPVGEAGRIVERLRSFKTARQYRQLVKAEGVLQALRGMNGNAR